MAHLFLQVQTRQTLRSCLDILLTLSYDLTPYTTLRHDLKCIFLPRIFHCDLCVNHINVALFRFMVVIKSVRVILSEI